MSELGCPPMGIHSTLSRYLSLRRCLSPVVHDVLLRLFLTDKLIVGSRLYFLKALNTTIQQCIRESCVAIETLEHMWQSLWLPWSKIFKVNLSWQLLLFLQSRDIKADWKQHHKLLLPLGRVHTVIVFHATLRLRHKLYFNETETEKDAVILVLQGMGFDPPNPRNLPE
ncbi:hypothetical protein PHMEG_00013363 [Phytophthora megakarya]|uniref:Uncharacterized protein n=1 Tax=Phytophthora megakarya TaxID=4795 RepID=A0A225W8J6_9STRA|nr:hypothetical protein PHMEG_00013363 [Phytophthora megakarya]